MHMHTHTHKHTHRECLTTHLDAGVARNGVGRRVSGDVGVRAYPADRPARLRPLAGSPGPRSSHEGTTERLSAFTARFCPSRGQNLAVTVLYVRDKSDIVVMWP